MDDAFVASAAALSLKGAVVVALVALIDRLLGRRLHPRARYALWALAIARFLLPYGPELPCSMHGVLLQPAETPKIVFVENSGQPSHQWKAAYSSPVEASPPVESGWSATSIAGVVWVVGSLVCSLWLAVRWRRSMRFVGALRTAEDPSLALMLDDCIAIMGVRRPIRMAICSGGGDPCVLGWRHPTIVMPAAMVRDFNESELRLALLHELAHVVRRDVLVAWFAEFVRVVHWWNPAAWWALAGLASSREAACDALVLEKVGADRRVEYGRTLVRVMELGLGGPSRRDIGVPALRLLGRRRAVKGRILMIVSAKDRGSRFWKTSGAAIVAAVATFGLTDAPKADDKSVPATKTLPVATEANPGRAGVANDEDQIVVEMRFLTGAADLMTKFKQKAKPEGDRVWFLNDREAFLLLEAGMSRRDFQILQSPKVTVLDGRTGTLELSRSEPVVAKSAAVPVLSNIPYLSRLFTNASVVEVRTATTATSCRAKVSSDKRFIRLDLKVTSSLESAPLNPTAAEGPHQSGRAAAAKPERRTRVDTSFSLPSGGSALLELSGADGDSPAASAVLVRVERLTAEMIEALFKNTKGIPTPPAAIRAN